MGFGSAKEQITPPFPTRLACAGEFDKDFRYVHDDIFVRCLVVDDGATVTFGKKNLRQLAELLK